MSINCFGVATKIESKYTTLRADHTNAKTCYSCAKMEFIVV
jgi:hypothetical protein